jgi:hypothetical protein
MHSQTHTFLTLGAHVVRFYAQRKCSSTDIVVESSMCVDILDGEFEQWCVADEQTPDEDLQAAMDWACGKGGADCSKIQVNQACYFPNTVKDHASYAFNNYFQKFKHQGGSCYFKGAAMITELDPSNKH